MSAPARCGQHTHPGHGARTASRTSPDQGHAQPLRPFWAARETGNRRRLPHGAFRLTLLQPRGLQPPVRGTRGAWRGRTGRQTPALEAGVLGGTPVLVCPWEQSRNDQGYFYVQMVLCLSFPRYKIKQNTSSHDSGEQHTKTPLISDATYV